MIDYCCANCKYRFECEDYCEDYNEEEAETTVCCAYAGEEDEE